MIGIVREVIKHVHGGESRSFSVLGQSCGAAYALDTAVRFGSLVDSVYLVSPWLSLRYAGTNGTVRTLKSMFPSCIIRAGIGCMSSMKSIMMSSMSPATALKSFSDRERVVFERDDGMKDAIMEVS